MAAVRDSQRQGIESGKLLAQAILKRFMTSLRDMAVESGLIVKRLDKKLETTLLHSYRKVHNKALQAPGRAILLPSLNSSQVLQRKRIFGEKLNPKLLQLMRNQVN